MLNLAAPKDQKGVEVYYYKNFVEGYSKIYSPLNNLLKKGTPFVWSQECEEVLNTLKYALTPAPILAFPDINKSFVLTCDASKSGLGYILGQEDKQINEKK